MTTAILSGAQAIWMRIPILQPSEENYYVRQNSSCEDGENGALIGCFPAGCGPVNVGPVWYVDQNGSNTNDGGLETPFQTIARALESSDDGDTIRLSKGSTMSHLILRVKILCWSPELLSLMILSI